MAAAASWLTFSVTPLVLARGTTELSRGTGFFLKVKDQWFLVTNWHVLSGRDPRNGQPLSKTGAIPDTCHFSLLSYDGKNLVWFRKEFSLGDPLAGSARWQQHAEHGQAVDIGVVAISDPMPLQVRDMLDPEGHDDHMWVDLGGEVFLPGYPLGLTAGGAMPVWKRGSLASSTEFGDGVTKYVLIDTATREGMSGSPCLAISKGTYFRRASDSMKMTRVDDPFRWRLMGIYSGRINPSDSFEAQLGIVWRKELIMETIEAGSSATVVLT